MKKILFFAGWLFATNAVSQAPSYVPSNGLVGYWAFNGNANDISGNGNNGIPTNVNLTTDRFGIADNAYLFNGSTSRIDINNAFFNIGWNEYTISCWSNSSSLLNPNNYNDSQILINTVPHNGVAISTYSSNNPFTTNWVNKYVMLANSNPTIGSWNVTNIDGYSNCFRTINNWNHIVMTKSGNTYKMYINGILDKTLIGSMSADTYFCKIVIGALDANITPEVFLGKLDDYGIWNRALTTAEITNLYISGNCSSQVTLSSPNDDFSSGNYLKIASNTTGKITATNKITSSTRVIYQAKSVELNNGFKADSGTVFRAEVGGCD